MSTENSLLVQLLEALSNIKFASLAQGMPAAGGAGQVLGKASVADFDVAWVDPGGVAPGGMINVKSCGAVGDGVADDTTAFQNAIDLAQTQGLKGIWVPAHDSGAYYKCGSAELLITKPLRIVGEHPLVTIGNQAGGLGSTQYLFKVDGTAFPNYEHFGLKSLSLRPELGGTACRGVLLNRVSYPVFEDVIISNASVGVEWTGDRGYASSWRQVRIKGCAKGMRIAAFTGGGHHNFYGCSFTSNIDGFELAADSMISGANFFGLALEQNTGRPFRCEGNVHGMTFIGGYAEQNTLASGHTLGFVPATGKVQRGIVIHGGIWDTDNEAYAFLFGGTGTVRGIDIRGLEAEGYSTALVRSFSGGVTGGQITSNYVNAIPAITDGSPTRVLVANNEGNSGAVT